MTPYETHHAAALERLLEATDGLPARSRQAAVLAARHGVTYAHTWSDEFALAQVEALEARLPGDALWRGDTQPDAFTQTLPLPERLWRACLVVNPDFELGQFKSSEKISNACVLITLRSRVGEAPFEAPDGYVAVDGDRLVDLVVDRLARAGQDFACSSSAKWRIREAAQAFAFEKEGDALGRAFVALPMNYTQPPSRNYATGEVTRPARVVHDVMAFGLRGARTAAKHGEIWAAQFDTLAELA